MFYSNNPLIKHKTGLLNLAEELGNISQAVVVVRMFSNLRKNPQIK
ncbi:TPA: hypothetical protein PW733_002681 [Mannheimia haemolytica]|nr:hypothetical protein [Mannheimia haemolytica]AGK01947.1 hypothetical protein MHH_c14960 [Mannheimia haemolytica M42548]AGR74675.1 hypothetical protein N220_04670 [Mannheimia haemolytica USMARC_2286]EPZ23901.1 hypothetical protein L281_14330 [Mannheimia haemolytica MhSwine2000]EPZ27483.1 hypothetical protein L280_13260 [Mannheimia haemolytica MhBrain2012]KYL05968.1 transposase [Mannheimia haemolytica]